MNSIFLLFSPLDYALILSFLIFALIYSFITLLIFFGFVPDIFTVSIRLIISFYLTIVIYDKVPLLFLSHGPKLVFNLLLLRFLRFLKWIIDKLFP